MLDRERLSRFVDTVSVQLIKASEKAGAFDHTNYADWNRNDIAVADLKRAMEAEGAVFSARRDHATACRHPLVEHVGL